MPDVSNGKSTDAFVHSQSICDLNTGERGIEGEAKEIFIKSIVNIGFSKEVVMLKKTRCADL